MRSKLIQSNPTIIIICFPIWMFPQDQQQDQEEEEEEQQQQQQQQHFQKQ